MIVLIDRDATIKKMCEMCGYCSNNSFCRKCNMYDFLKKQPAIYALCEQPKTNADRIRQMTDEELADFLSGEYCFSRKYMPENRWFEWLKKEELKKDDN